MDASGWKTRWMVRATVRRALWALAAGTAVLVLPQAHAAGRAIAPAAAEAKVPDLRGEAASEGVRYVAEWSVRSGDHAGLPFVVVDKQDGRVFVFDAQGQLRGVAPALVGAARGDDTIPGIGSRPIAAIRPEERVTPAGRYNAVIGQGPKGEDILWVDYDAALALHRVVTHVPAERRLERLQSKLPADRRITYGCINVPAQFYDSIVRTVFSGARGVVYILPESKKPQDVFGAPVRQALHQEAGGAASAGD